MYLKIIDKEKKMHVDVIIATNRPMDLLIPVLNSYRDQSYKDFSIIIVAEGETESFQKIVEQYEWDNIKIYSVPKGTSNAGVSRNHGMKQGKGEIILFSDDDMIVTRSFIEEHVACHMQQKEVIVRGLRYQKRIDGSFYITHWEEEALKHWNNEKKSTAWMYFVTSNASVSRSLIEKAGDFDPLFVWSGGEDTDLAYRLIREGATLIANEKAINFHLGIDDLQEKFEKRIPNFLYLQEKYPEDPMVKWFVRLTLLAVKNNQINKMFTYETLRGN